MHMSFTNKQKSKWTLSTKKLFLKFIKIIELKFFKLIVWYTNGMAHGLTDSNSIISWSCLKCELCMKNVCMQCKVKFFYIN